MSCDHKNHKGWSSYSGWPLWWKCLWGLGVRNTGGTSASGTPSLDSITICRLEPTQQLPKTHPEPSENVLGRKGQDQAPTFSPSSGQWLQGAPSRHLTDLSAEGWANRKWMSPPKAEVSQADNVSKETVMRGTGSNPRQDFSGLRRGSRSIPACSEILRF